MQAISYQTYTIIVSCDSIIDFLANSYFIVEIHHAKSFEMKYCMSLYLNLSLEYSTKCLKAWYEIACIRRYMDIWTPRLFGSLQYESKTNINFLFFDSFKIQKSGKNVM